MSNQAFTYTFTGLTGAECESAWSDSDRVYFSAVGRIYEQCVPWNSVHVVFSSNATVYLSTRFEHCGIFTHNLVRF